MSVLLRIFLAGLLLFVVGGSAEAQIAPTPDAPQCASHNPRAWHGLWNAELGCHYDHQHGDDPRALNDLFGTSLFSLMGGTISHPWQTFSAAGMENDLKHAGYFWHAKRNLPCASNGCITAFRLLVHQHPSGRDATVRFHSGVLEAQVLNTVTGRSGYIQLPGMWVDFGHLHIDGQRVIDEGMEAEPGRHRQHGTAGTPQIIWYGATQATHTPDRRGRIPRGFASISTSVHDVWDYTSPSDPARTDDYACYPNTRCPANATLLRPHLVVIQGTAGRIGNNRGIVDPDGDGIIDWRGYTDRYGVPLQAGTCSTPSLDCVPVRLQGIEIDTNYSCDSVCGRLYTEHDVLFNRRTSGWSQPRP